MTKHWTSVRNLIFFFSSVAGVGLLIPGSPAYLPTVWGHYSNFHFGHSLGYWLRAVDKSDVQVRRDAIYALGAMGENAAEAVPSLAGVLTEDTDRDARLQATLALLKIGSSSSAAVAALARALDEDESPQVRMNAAIALSRLGTQARPAVLALLRAVKRGANRAKVVTFDFTVQDVAALALGRATAGSSEAVGPLMEALKNARTVSKRWRVVEALGAVGPPARPAESLLVPLLNDDNPLLRDAAEIALHNIRAE